MKGRQLSGDELRARVDRLGLSAVTAAEKLGLTEDALTKQMSGQRRVGRQTAVILDLLEEAARAGSPESG